MPPHLRPTPSYEPTHRGTRRPLRPRFSATTVLAGALATCLVVPASAATGAGDQSDEIPHDRTPARSRTLSPVGLASLVPPATVVAGHRLVAKPPPPPPPWVLPVTGYHLTGRFGQVSGLWSTVHTGLDFAAAEGTPIHSIGPGVVVSTGYEGAYGNKTVVKLDDGTVLWFCHQSRFAVAPGRRLGIGDLVGYVGSTGNVTGAHLHLEVHPGGQKQAIDPATWLPEHHLHP
ncbi:MAG: hypothetical protein JWR42_1159 [Marmoricola sp.]|nr:hypothetical protein [Marmoricola sp.]